MYPITVHRHVLGVCEKRGIASVAQRSIGPDDRHEIGKLDPE